MNITRVSASNLVFPARPTAGGLGGEDAGATCFVEVETADGTTGYGLTGITQAEVVTECINRVAAPAIIGQNALDHELIGHTLYWTLSPWGQTGYASHATAAIDLALWDIKGKAAKQPVWRLLGGARQRMPIYITFGGERLDSDGLVTVAKDIVAQGYSRLKMRVGRPGLSRRTMRPAMDDIIASDVQRIGAVREALGPVIGLALDAGNRLDYPSALRLCKEAEPFNIAFFEEPIIQNDAALLAQLRRHTCVPIAAGQNEGLPFRFREMLVAEALDYAQPNAAICCGITQAAKVAGMAAAFNVPISNGGGHAPHNAHLQAGAINGTMVECHVGGFGVYEQIFKSLPAVKDGWLELSEAPGFGLEPDADRVNDARR
jgi:L-rhamnonate dehydratase